MTAFTPPPPGSFFLSQIGGWAGRWVGAAQAFVRGGSYWTHAGVVVGGGTTVEAHPGGARFGHVDELGDAVVFCDEPVLRRKREFLRGVWYLSQVEAFERQERADVVQAALDLVGTPYSFLDYVALAALEWDLPGHAAVRRYVQDSGHLICSALVDRVYERAGIELFDDGRLNGDVTPGDLDRWIRNADAGLDPTTTTLRTEESP